MRPPFHLAGIVVGLASSFLAQAADAPAFSGRIELRLEGALAQNHKKDAPSPLRYLDLYAQTYPAVYGFIVSLLAGSREADDLMQQTSLVLWRKFHEFAAGSNFTAWACQVAKFEVLNHLRARSRDRHVFSEEIIHGLAAEHGGEIERLEAERRALEGCLRKLPEGDRRLLRDCYADGATLKEVAARAGRTANSLYKWLEPGPLELTHGYVELTFGRDATALLQAPVRLVLLGRRHIALHLGRLVVRADRARGEFIVETPETKVTDLGTEFGVGVGPSGDTQVQVYEGRVVAEWKAPDGKASGRRRLEAGEAIYIGRQADAADPLAFSPDRFVRTFPVIEGDTGGGSMYSRSRFETIRIVPAPRPVTLDGSLAEWDLGGQFRSACMEPYDKAYFVQGAMMYDGECLYIGAHVGQGRVHPEEMMRSSAQGDVGHFRSEREGNRG